MIRAKKNQKQAANLEIIMKCTLININPNLPHIDTDTSKIRSLSQESSKCEPE